jgi:cytidine deaminase|tara:strand:- start:193 stop:618 length:426 start_codon:yes stop_codon:yes gene_type:complete
MQGLKLIKTEKNKKILELSYSMMLNAYSPYSNFSVGAAILSERNRLFGGCNVENAAYPEGTCAEAGAISAMIAGGCKTIKEIYVISQSENIVSPCGGCRQKIREFSSKNTKIYLCNIKWEYKLFTLEELLPFSFSEFDDLK